MHPNENLPLTVNPQKALAFGVEKALLVELLEQFAVLTPDSRFTISTSRIQQRCPFWSSANRSVLRRSFCRRESFPHRLRGSFGTSVSMINCLFRATLL